MSLVDRRWNYTAWNLLEAFDQVQKKRRVERVHVSINFYGIICHLTTVFLFFWLHSLRSGEKVWTKLNYQLAVKSMWLLRMRQHNQRAHYEQRREKKYERWVRSAGQSGVETEIRQVSEHFPTSIHLGIGKRDLNARHFLYSFCWFVSILAITFLPFFPVRKRIAAMW